MIDVQFGNDWEKKAEFQNALSEPIKADKRCNKLKFEITV